MTDKQIITKSQMIMRIAELSANLEAKEQECKNNKIAHQMELDIYNQECLNLSEELKETLEQLDQLKAELEAYKMEADEGKEINAELKAENGYLKHKIFRYEEIFKHSADMTKNPVTAIELEIFQSGVRALGNSLIAEENNKLHKTLTEIKELIQSDYCTEIGSCEFCAEIGNCLNRKILQKISECEGNDE